MQVSQVLDKWKFAQKEDLMENCIRSLELPVPTWTKKYGYLKWHREDDEKVNQFFGDQTTVKIKVLGGKVGTKIIERKYRRILNSSIANFEAFNTVRNDQSFAHDNPILNYEESLLILNHVVSVIRFIQALERRQAASNKEHDRVEHNDIPF